MQKNGENQPLSSEIIADMEEKEFILPVHLAEAIDFRKLCSNLVPEI